MKHQTTPEITPEITPENQVRIPLSSFLALGKKLAQGFPSTARPIAKPLSPMTGKTPPATTKHASQIRISTESFLALGKQLAQGFPNTARPIVKPLSPVKEPLSRHDIKQLSEVIQAVEKNVDMKTWQTTENLMNQTVSSWLFR